MEAALGARGAVFRAGFENEFTLAQADGEWRPVDSSLCFSTIGMTASPRTTSTHSSPPSKNRASRSTSTTPSLARASEADDGPRARASRGRRADHGARDDPRRRHDAGARGLARTEAVARRGRKRLPHPFLGLGPGRLGKSLLLARRAPVGRGRAFAAGLLEHLYSGLCSLTVPSFNSFRRISPQTWSGDRCWGFDNREAPLRVPSVFRGMEEASTNVELKAADRLQPLPRARRHDRRGLDGLDRGLELPEPVDVDPATMSDGSGGTRHRPAPEDAGGGAGGARGRCGTRRCARRDAHSLLPHGRRSRWEAYSAEDEAFEHQGHFLKY